jgi:hypothetical protein
MHFAINWSPEAAALLAADEIEIDLYKCPDWVDVVTDARTQRPAYIHFPLVIGSGQVATWDFQQIETWLKTTETLFVNCHITPQIPAIALDIAQDDLVEVLAAEISQLTTRFGAERVIIENTPFMQRHHERGYLPQGADPALFQQLTRATGCGFLLDISHAALTCEDSGADVYEYLNALPVDRLRELHVTGIGTWTTGIRGDHQPLQDSDWQRLDWCVQQMQAGTWRVPDVVAFEYGGIGKLKELCGSDREAIAQQVPRLYATAHGMVAVR